jgi:CMP-N-acetylneuraminic acid synthetase
MVDVLGHALSWLAKEQGYRADVVVLLQPTSPLRRAAHIDGVVDLLVSTGADTVVSVVQVPHQYSPVSLMEVDANGLLRPYLDQSMILRRQDKPKVYARNGPAVLAVSRQILEQGKLYGNVIRPFEMDLAESVDIDVIDDVALTEFWLRRQWAKS